MHFYPDNIAENIGKIVRLGKQSGSIVVSMNKKIIYRKNHGYADLMKKVPISNHTQFLAGSVTKQFAAVAILKALSEKYISGTDKDQVKNIIQTELNNPLEHWLPESHDIWDGSMPAWTKIVTLHHVLTHSSGITNYNSLKNFENTVFHKNSDIVSFFKNHDLEFMPGENFSYSNSGYFLLQAIIQQITQQPANVYLETAFFRPLLMRSTFLPTKGTVSDLIRSDARFQHLAKGYEYDVIQKDPQLEEVSRYEPMNIPGTAGSLVSTPDDLLKWNNALYDGEIIPYPILDLLLEPYIATEFPNEFYGYGITIVKSENLGNYYYHGGGIPGFRSRLTYIPSLKMSLVVMQNTVGDQKKLAPEIEALKSTFSDSLAREEVWSEISKIMEAKYPEIDNNRKIYELMSIYDAIIKILSH